MPRKRELELDLEERCVRRVEALGGMALKLRPPTGKGFPDRTCVIPETWVKGHNAEMYTHPHTFYVEFKRPKTGAVSTQQHRWRVLLTQMGFGVYLIDTDEDFERALERELGR